ncbi:MAG: ATP-dependent 6-phosphofructokinase [Verrucomicrobia bacterium]|nr:ATP-dependent 6-phosphofructokinase [Verrucomicrobiota bacterium]
MKPIRRVGILTAGGDSPGLNAAIRAVGKSLLSTGIEVIGFRDGFQGLIDYQTVLLDKHALAGILTVGGTVLGTSRVKPHRVEIRGTVHNLTGAIVDNCARRGLDALVCIGGGGTHKNALHLVEQGLKVVTLPKTIDNDLAFTDATIGFDTALGIATEAVDRLHSTAHSHHRIVIAEIMGHRAGWLALGAGIAGGADVILIPEIPYDVRRVADAILRRCEHGTNFSIVAVAEGALSNADAPAIATLLRRRQQARSQAEKLKAKRELDKLYAAHEGNTLRLARRLEELTRLEARVTILGYVQRGGAPSAADRLLATRLGTACAQCVRRGVFGVMVAARGDTTRTVPIHKVAGSLKTVPPNHPWIQAARRVGTCLGN